MSETKHAELPWEVSYTDTNGQRVIQGASSEICTCWHHCVVSLEEQMEANAEFICRAVNAHYDLLEACRKAYAYIVREQETNRVMSPAENELHSELAAAMSKAQPTQEATA